MSCRLRTFRSIHGPRCIFSPSLSCISPPSSQVSSKFLENISTYMRQIPRIAAAFAPAAAIANTQMEQASSPQQRSIGAQHGQQRVGRPFWNCVVVGVELRKCEYYLEAPMGSSRDMMSAKTVGVGPRVAYLARKLHVFAAGECTATVRREATHSQARCCTR
jgi:hypothetical protein